MGDGLVNDWGGVGASSAFLLARYLLHDWAVSRYGEHPLLIRLNKSMAQHCLKLVIVVRLFPISPFNLVNFLFGLTKASLLDYSFGTAIGIIPGTALYTFIGQSGRQALEGKGGSFGDCHYVFDFAVGVAHFY